MSLNRPSSLRGLTLIEILIALVMTLIVLGAMMYAFRYASNEISRGRAVMELSNQLLVVEQQLREDFDGVTVDLRPWAKSSSPNGYFEYVEGSTTDKSYLDSNSDNALDATYANGGVFGDMDDAVAMTVRSRSRPFRGRFNGNIIESNVAEIIWWTSFEDRNGDGVLSYGDTTTLHRRVLLVRPDLLATLNTSPGILEYDPGNGFDVQKFFLENDISARPVDRLGGDGVLDTMIPNSLADLSKRENRFAHLWNESTLPNANEFPHQLSFGLLDSFSLTAANVAQVNANASTPLPATFNQYLGDDVIMTDVAGFDLQIFSPDTQIRFEGNQVFEPDDVHYESTTVAQTIETGAFIDLGHRRTAVAFDVDEPQFSTAPLVSPDVARDLRYNDVARPNTADFVVYDTFSTHYDMDGADNDNDGDIDEATDGIDSDSTDGVDDNGEREALPPYPYRALGMKATVRVVEPVTAQVRQTEIISSFVPQ